LESNAPVILSVPDSVFNPEAPIEQNVIAWQTKKHILFGSEDDVIEFDYFKIYKHKINKFLSFNSTTQKNEILKRTITTRISYIFNIIFFYFFTCSFTLILLFKKETNKDLRKEYENGDIPKNDYRKDTRILKYFLLPTIIFLCILLFASFLTDSLLNVSHCLYTIPGLFLPLLIFFLAVMTSMVIKKICLAKITASIAKKNEMTKENKDDFIGEDTQE
jgi:hypothetical protein